MEHEKERKKTNDAWSKLYSAAQQAEIDQDRRWQQQAALIPDNPKDYTELQSCYWVLKMLAMGPRINAGWAVKMDGTRAQVEKFAKQLNYDPAKIEDAEISKGDWIVFNRKNKKEDHVITGHQISKNHRYLFGWEKGQPDVEEIQKRYLCHG